MHLCNYEARPVSQKQADDKDAKQLTTEQVAYLCAEDTHKRMAGKSLDERCMLFEVAYPGKKINRDGLRSVYAKHGIKRKTVR